MLSFCQETGYEPAEVVIRKIQKTLLDVMQKNRWPITFSFGVVTFNNPPDTVDEIIKRADALCILLNRTVKT